MEKRVTIWFLLALNLLAFTTFAITFYFGFLTLLSSLEPLVWGLPTVLASIVTIIAVILISIKRNARFGVYSIGLSVVTFLYIFTLLNYYSYIMLPEQDIASSKHDSFNNQVISEFLSSRAVDNRYIVVRPYTTSVTVSNKYEIIDRLSMSGYNSAYLLETFLIINNEEIEMTLTSSPQEGYYFDYDDIFTDQGIIPPFWSWLFRPQVMEYAMISQPVYDEGTGYGLIYIEHVSNSRRVLGSGELFLFKYEEQEFLIIKTIPLSII